MCKFILGLFGPPKGSFIAERPKRIIQVASTTILENMVSLKCWGNISCGITGLTIHKAQAKAR
jgi:hypothetical protein